MTPSHDRSLLVMQDEPHYCDGRCYRSEMNFGYFVDWVAAQLGRTTLAVPTTRQGEPFGQTLDLPHVRFYELPYWRSLVSYLRLGRSDRRTLHKVAGRLVEAHDALMVRLPSLPACVFAAQARRQGKPLITYLGGNILTAANALRSGNPITRIAARAMARYVHVKMMRLVNQAAVAFAMGRELFEMCDGRAKTAHQLITSLISENEIFERADSFAEHGPTILFRAARLNPNKGTEHLLHAMKTLMGRGYDVRLRLAGGGDDPGYVAGLQEWCRQNGVAERVDWLGQVPFGPGVFALYRQSHIGVLSSLAEGFPRFINEAWAFSLPVVATRLPGLCPPVEPEVNAVLVDPGSPEALADGIQRVIDDRKLRQALIRGGLETARKNTAEQQSRRVANLIADAIDQARRSS